MEGLKIFNCSKCGLCCRNLNNNDIYKYLHDGDGICKYLNIKSNLCNKYNTRPDICNIDKAYQLYFKNEYSISEYYKLNYEGCRYLHEKEGRKNKK